MALTNEGSEFGKAKKGVVESKPLSEEEKLKPAAQKEEVREPEEAPVPEAEKDDGNPGGGEPVQEQAPKKTEDRGDGDKPFITKAEMCIRECKMCGAGVPHLVVTMDKDTDKIFVHAPFSKKWLMNEMMDAVKREFEKRNTTQK